jgi:uncharacterized protein YjiK
VYDTRSDTLYVASTEDNEIFALHDAGKSTHDLGKGVVIYRDPEHLHGPLGLAAAPNGDLLVTNSDVIHADTTQPSTIVEFTRSGQFVKQLSLDRKPGAAFGIAVEPAHDGARFAAVNDNYNRLTIWTLNGDFAPGSFDF